MYLFILHIIYAYLFWNADKLQSTACWQLGNFPDCADYVCIIGPDAHALKVVLEPNVADSSIIMTEKKSSAALVGTVGPDIFTNV
jgi:hypothetical protein